MEKHRCKPSLTRCPLRGRNCCQPRSAGHTSSSDTRHDEEPVVRSSAYFYNRRSPTSQTSSPGMHCIRLLSIRCLWPSATQTRRAVKRQVSRPLVPRRQLTLCHLPSANNASAETGG